MAASDKVSLSLDQMLCSGGPMTRQRSPTSQSTASGCSSEEPRLRPRVPTSPSMASGGSIEDAAPKRTFLPYHSQSVPKSENLSSQLSSSGGSSVTTMMLRNIPNKYTQNTLLQEIDDLGFVRLYDFFYLPMDVHNRSNVGYAFINFWKPEDAEQFRGVFSEHRFQKFQSRKISSVCSAHVQGLDENLKHFENRAVTHARNDQYRPIVFEGNCRVDFEEAVAGAKARLAAKGASNAPLAPAAGPRGRRPAAEWSPPSAAGPAPTAAHGCRTGRLGGTGLAAAPAAAPASAEHSPWTRRTTPQTPPPPVVTPAGAARMFGARGGLDGASHQWMHQAYPGMLPPGLGGGAQVDELLSLKSCLVDRLHQEQRVESPPGLFAPFAPGPRGFKNDAPAYVKLPFPSDLSGKLFDVDLGASVDGATPRWSLGAFLEPVKLGAPQFVRSAVEPSAPSGGDLRALF